MKSLTLVIFVQFILQSHCENVTEISSSPIKVKIVFIREGTQNLNDVYKKISENYPDINIDFKDVVLDRLDPVEAKKTLCNLLETNGISVTVDITLTGFEQRKGISQMGNIPYFHFDMNVQPFVHFMTTYLQARMANDAVFVFQTEEEADQALYYFIVRNNLRVIVLDKLMPSTIQRLKTLKPIPNFYAIIANTQEMNRIFKMAIDNELITMPERWNIMFTDFQMERFDYIRMTQNLSFLSLDQSFCCKTAGLAVNCDCPDKISLKNLLLEHFLNALIKILIKDNSTVHVQKCDNTVKETMQQDKMLVQFKQILKEDNLLYVESDFKIGWNLNFTVSKLDESQSKLRNELFIDNDGVQAIDNYEVSSLKRFLRIGTIESPPWSFFKRDSSNNIMRDNEGNPMWTGYCIDFAEKIAERMNFDYEFVVPRSGRFGNKNKNGVWDGLIGDLVRGETDVIIAPLRMTAEREEVIDFVAPYFEQTGILIAMRKPVKETSLFKFMTVLRLEVWMSILAALVVTALMIWFFDKYSPYSSRNNSSYTYPCREFTLKESFWFALTSFTPQGGGEPPKSLSGRTLVAAYWLFVVLMLATFTANLAAFLTVERMQTPVQSLEQLARQSRINYTVVKDSAAHKYFSNMKHAEDKMYEMWKSLTLNSSTDESIYRVYDYPIREQFGHILLAIESANPVETAAEGFRKVNERDDFALIHDSAEIRYEISKNCNLTEVGEVFGSVSYSIAVQEGSHLQDDLSRTILTLQKDRYLEALTAKYWNNSVRGVCEDDDSNEGITLESLGGVFIATLFGLALAMITLFGEIIYYKKKDEKNLIRKVTPFDSADKNAVLKKIENAKQITLGDSFIPSIDRKPRLSYISMFSKPEEDLIDH